MAYTIDVDPAGYTDAASVTRGLLTDLRAAGHAVVSGLGGSHGMAGSDQGGQTWATDYDQAAKSILGDTSKLLTAFDSIAVALGVTGYNHAVAEHRAGGTGALTASSVPTATAVESLPHPPSAHGGNRQFPWGFQYVSDLIGMAWPDGDTGKLRTAGSRWDAFAAAVDAIDTAGPLASISGFTSPEIAGIESKFSDARQVVSALATEARALARGCRKRADTIEKVHGETEKELIQLAATIGATVAASALLTPFTLGISDAAGAGAVATETGISVARIVAWLTEAVETTIATAGEIAEAISGVSGLGAMIEGLAVRVAPMVVVAGANAVVQGGSSAAIDGVVNGTSANLGEDVLFGALLPGGGALKSAKSTGEKLVATGTREAEEAAAAKAAADSVVPSWITDKLADETLPYWKRNRLLGQKFNYENHARYPQNEIRLQNGKYLDSYIPGRLIVSRKFTQLDRVLPTTAKRYIDEIDLKYKPGTVIGKGPATLRGTKMLEIPVQDGPIPTDVLAYATRQRVLIRDVTGHSYNSF